MTMRDNALVYCSGCGYYSRQAISVLRSDEAVMAEGHQTIRQIQKEVNFMFRIGDKVVCVDGEFDAETAATFSPLPVRGKIYCVRGTCIDAITGLHGVWVVGVRGIYYIGERERPLRADRFRKVWTAHSTTTTELEHHA